MGTSCCTSKAFSVQHSDKDIVNFSNGISVKQSSDLTNQLVFIVDEGSEIGMPASSLQKYAEKRPHKLFLKNDVGACFKYGVCETANKDAELTLTQESEDKTVTV